MPYEINHPFVMLAFLATGARAAAGSYVVDLAQPQGRLAAADRIGEMEAHRRDEWVRREHLPAQGRIGLKRIDRRLRQPGRAGIVVMGTLAAKNLSAPEETTAAIRAFLST